MPRAALDSAVPVGPARMRGARRAALACAAAAGLLAPAARAQGCETFGPLSDAVRVSEASAFDQFWVQSARGGDTLAFTWSAGQNIVARFFDAALQPRTGDLLVNPALSFDNQDEPAIACAASGRALIAWSDRAGYDGEQMGVFARLYDPSGNPLTSEFQVNVAGAASQWRPLIATTPAGGFVVAWSGDWDGDAFFRVFDANASALSGDVRVAVYDNDAQVDPAPAVAPDGTIFVAFVDYSSHGGVGSGLNVWGRTFDAAGNPRQSEEFPLTSWSGAGDQREPRVAADGLGRFVVVWEDQTHDGSGYGLLARRFDGAGNALEPEFQVNATSAGEQRAVAVAAEAAGSWTLAYEDRSLGSPRILARRFDANAAPLGAEVQVSGDPATRTTIAQDPAGGDVLFAFEAPGNATDVFARPFRASAGPQVFCAAKTSADGCVPSIGWFGDPSASNPGIFRIRCADVPVQRTGFLLYSHASRFLPFQGGTLCVGAPFRRTPPQSSHGFPGVPCTGVFAFDFNAWTQSGIDPSLGAGATISAQYYFRDPGDAFGTGLSDALRFTICP